MHGLFVNIVGWTARFGIVLSMFRSVPATCGGCVGHFVRIACRPERDDVGGCVSRPAAVARQQRLDCSLVYFGDGTLHEWCVDASGAPYDGIVLGLITQMTEQRSRLSAPHTAFHHHLPSVRRTCRLG
jgi:hypothetical protein